MKSQLFKALVLTTAVGLPAIANAYHEAPVDEVQTKIDAPGNLSRELPRDGSACDPSVIAANLKRLKATGILQVTNLTTTAASGHCYSLPCGPADVERAVAHHCAKAEALAEMIVVAEKPR